MDRFELGRGHKFWPGVWPVEAVRERGRHALLACTGPILFGAVNWSSGQPLGRCIARREALEA